MSGFFKHSFNPKLASFDDIEMFGQVAPQFEAFAPDPGLSCPTVKDGEYPLIKPVTPPPFNSVGGIINRMIQSAWKIAEPKKGAARGNLVIGTRGGPSPATLASDTYHPQVRPVKAEIYTRRPDTTAIASDWRIFQQIERTNAVTFRGDTRCPADIADMNGFTPPNSRTDRYYLEEVIYKFFSDYFERRYGTVLSKADFISAVDQVLTDAQSKKIMVDYMMWRKIVEKEAVNLGRMTQNECLKGYISTSRSVKTAAYFGTGYGRKNGWIYVTLIGLGFVVPPETKEWGTGEQEIAHWGAIPFSNVVGARRLDAGSLASGPIYFRPTFQKKEPKAFEKAFRLLNSLQTREQRDAKLPKNQAAHAGK